MFLRRIFDKMSARRFSQECSGKFDLNECFEVSYKLVQKAAELVAEASQSARTFTTKQTNIDLLTETDQAVERLLMEGLHKRYPAHKFIAEEQTATDGLAHVLTEEPTWLIDPIDGTMNFVHGFPYYCISVGLWVNKTPMLGIISNPALQQCYTARQGQGAFLNNQRIRVSGQQQLQQALIMFELGSDYASERVNVLENLDHVTMRAHAMRSLGSFALNLCMIAQGASDAFYGFGGHAWDLGAATLIVYEAGGVMLDTSGGELDLMSRRCLAAATPQLATELAQLLKQVHPKPRDDEQPTKKNESN